MIKALAFDLGRVLVDFDYNRALVKLRPFLGIGEGKVKRVIEKADFSLKFEKGIITPQEFFGQFRHITKLKSLGYPEFVNIWNDIFTLKEDMIRLVEKLRGKYFLILVSNLNQLHLHFLQQQYSFIWRLFDRLVISSLVGLIKPEPAIYKLMEEGFSKQELIYIDDRQDLVAQSRRQGYNTIRFETTDQCKQELQRRGVKEVKIS